MTISRTPNLQLPYPDGTELVSAGPSDFAGIATKLDQGTNGPTAMLYQKGTLAARPVATTVPIGGVYHCTDAPCLFVSDGTNWHYQSIDAGGPPVGAIQQYAGPADPVDPDGVTRWNICDGRAISRSANATLFSTIGTTYGIGDGSTTFNVPDMRQKFALGKAASGTGSSLGATGGAIDHNHPVPGLAVPGLSIPGLSIPGLTVASHDHPLSSVNAGAALGTEFIINGGANFGFYYSQGAPLPGNAYSNLTYHAGSPGTVVDGGAGLGSGNTPGIGLYGVTDSGGGGTTGGGTTGGGTTGGGTTGGGTTGSQNPPYLVINHIIKVQ